MKRVIAYCIIFLFSGVLLFGQDVHFSQNFATPLYVNPAMAGLYNGDARVSAVYRDQWSNLTSGTTDARTIMLSADAKLLSGPTDGSWLNAGINLYNDKSGEVGIYTNNVELTVSYNTPLVPKQFLSFGSSIGITQRKLDLTQAQFGNQYNGSGFDENINSNEYFDNEQFQHFNLSGGLVYYYLQSSRNYYFAGLAAYNITGARYSFQDFTETRIPMRLSAQLGGALTVSPTLDVVPSLYFMKQGKSMKTDLGSFARFIFSQNRNGGSYKAFNFGPFIRLVNSNEKAVILDALIFAIKVDYDDISIGMSYDFNISGLNNATKGKGGPEISLVYTPKIRDGRINAPISCPRF